MFNAPNEYLISDGELGSTDEMGNNGAFVTSFESFNLRVIASDGMGWEHVSVSLPNRCPNWREICFIKGLFWDEEDMDTDIQYQGFLIRPVTILLEKGYGLRVEIFEQDGRQIAPHHIPTFEETFATREEAIAFGFAEGKKLIDSGQLSRPTS